MSWGQIAETSTKSGPAPQLAGLVRRGTSEPELVQVNEFIWMSQDVSNSYIVSTPDGCVVVNAGSEVGGRRHRALYDAASLGPIRYLVLTQSHTDHIGGLDSFADTGATLIAQKNLPDVRGYWMRLSEFYTQRSGYLWESVVGPRSPAHQREFTAAPDVMFDDTHSFELGGRRFELLSVPGGETTDSLAVWLPDARIVFSGNLLGPMYVQVPNLYTVRGDKIRSALEFVASVQRIIDLKPEILITGHGEPIRGSDKIVTDLTRIRDGVLHIHDETVRGMNEGKDVFTLMREIRLPEHLSLGEGHGKVAWNVRSIWEEYAGWFHFDSTTSLYAVPVSAIAGDLVEAAGGSAPLVKRAADHIKAGRPLEAIHLLNVVNRGDAQDESSLTVELSALERLLSDSQRANLSETMWLSAEIDRVQENLRSRA